MGRISPTISLDAENAAVARALASHLGTQFKIVDVASGDTYDVPPELAAAVRQLFDMLAAGTTVTPPLAPDAELTPNEAADYLRASRTFVAKLMDEGTLPYRLVGTHRRIRYGDLQAYEKAQAARSRAAMAELTRLSQDMGLYEMDHRMNPNDSPAK